MTYCVGMVLNEGLVFASDSRTNAGVDHVSTFCKMTVLESPGEGVIVMLNSGNLATTQQVVSRIKQHASDSGQPLTSHSSMFGVAELLGRELRKTIATTLNEAPEQSDVDFSATFLVGGQLKGEAPRLFMVYPQGNFIESTVDTPFFQIGESKYGKPILDRVIQPAISMSQAIKCALVSFDSTIKSNLSVGLPIDLAMVKSGELRVTKRHRIDADDAYFRDLRSGWSQGLRQVFGQLPDPHWLA
ncbi:MAG: peptidase [Betaproteobacteria bacterium]|nr:peptidase [Betaproteobacteria bacterium]